MPSSMEDIKIPNLHSSYHRTKLYLPLGTSEDLPSENCRFHLKRRLSGKNSTFSMSSMSAQEVADCLYAGNWSPILLDCRPFFSYNRGHLSGAINVRCSDRICRRRLKQGKLVLTDLVTDSDDRERLKIALQASKEVVLYDENTSEIDFMADNGITIVITALKTLGAKCTLLRGGWQEFSHFYSDLCVKSSKFHVYPKSLNILDVSPLDVKNKTSFILPFLYLGSECDAADHEHMQEIGVTHVLNVTSHVPEYRHKDDTLFCRLSAADNCQQNLKQYFEKAFAFIEDARNRGGKVLVHCQAGISRSATIVIAYIMFFKKIPSLEAYYFVKRLRPIISPNLHFMGQLLELEQTLQLRKTPTPRSCRQSLSFPIPSSEPQTLCSTPIS